MVAVTVHTDRRRLIEVVTGNLTQTPKDEPRSRPPFRPTRELRCDELRIRGRSIGRPDTDVSDDLRSEPVVASTSEEYWSAIAVDGTPRVRQ